MPALVSLLHFDTCILGLCIALGCESLLLARNVHVERACERVGVFVGVHTLTLKH